LTKKINLPAFFRQKSAVDFNQCALFMY